MSIGSVRVTIRNGGSADLDVAVELFMGYMEFYGRRHDRQEVATFLAERQQRSESLLLLAWVDLDGGPLLAGMAHVYLTFSTLSLAPVWVLNDLFVAPKLRGTGVGRALLQAVRDRARQAGAAEVALETADDNIAARRLYESEGFEVGRGFVHYTLPLG